MPLIVLAVLGASGSGELVAREAYAFPFESHREWAQFMDRAPDPGQRPSVVSRYLNREQFDACATQEHVSLERLRYSSDGLEVRAVLARPRGNRPVPLVVFLHGGAARWGKITTLDILEFCHLAEQGFAVLAPTFRGEMGSEGKPNLGKGELADVMNLIAVADSLPELDTSRMALWGYSRGGGTGYRVLAHSDRFRVAILQAASADLVGDPRRAEFHEHVYPGVVDDYEADPEAALAALSAVRWPSKISAKTRVTLIHGTDDKRVPYGSSARMEKLLTREGRTVELVTFAEGGHSLRESWPKVRAVIMSALAPLAQR